MSTPHPAHTPDTQGNHHLSPRHSPGLRGPSSCLGTGLPAAAKQGWQSTHTAPPLPPCCSKGLIHHISEPCCTAELPWQRHTHIFVPYHSLSPAWDIVGEEQQQQQHTPRQLTVPGVCKQSRAQHVGNPSTASSWHNWPKLLLPCRTRMASGLNPPQSHFGLQHAKGGS